jgi:hypothetical protein
MKRVIRKFDDFKKSKGILEDVDPMMTPDSDNTIETDDDSSNLIDDSDDISGDEYDGSEEEESDEYYGTVEMKKLAQMLGTEVINNEIEFNGQKINFYSETEMFHIGKNKFKTAKEVIDFLKPNEEIAESKRFQKRSRR